MLNCVTMSYFRKKIVPRNVWLNFFKPKNGVSKGHGQLFLINPYKSRLYFYNYFFFDFTKSNLKMHI